MQKEAYHAKRNKLLTLFASSVRIRTLEARQTFTPGNMVLGLANGINSTLLETTCILAAALMAQLGITTVRMMGALRSRLDWKQNVCTENDKLKSVYKGPTNLVHRRLDLLPQNLEDKSRQPLSDLHRYQSLCRQGSPDRDSLCHKGFGSGPGSKTAFGDSLDPHSTQALVQA